MEIPLTKGFTAKISDVNCDRIKGLKFYAEVDRRGKVYARASINGRLTYLHVFLMSPPPGLQVDHIDGDGLNCTDENMRFATNRQNSRNRGPQRNNKSGYKGVSFRKYSWGMSISSECKRIHKAGFPTAEAAAAAYDEKAIELFGEFAVTNAVIRARSLSKNAGEQ